MSSPQIEDGYTRIANELLEALARIRIAGEARQVLDVIFRKTYGYRKKEDAISLSQFMLATNLKKVTVCKAIQKLILLNLITQKGNDIAKTYSINKDFATWKPLPKKVTLPKKVMNITQKGNNHYPKRVLQKKKEKRNVPADILELSNLLAEKIFANNPKHRHLSNGRREASVIKWADAIDKLFRIDKQSVEDIKTVIEWCQSDSFWKQNILSGDKLREKWDQIYPKAIEASQKTSWRE